MKDCIFCKIIDGEIPCMKIYEDDLVLAYLDIAPDSDGHTLIIPKKHYKDVFDIPSETLLHIYNVSKVLMKKLGYYNDTIDGSYGGNSIKATNAFQSTYKECAGANGKPDNSFGPKCWKKLFSLLK